MATETEIDQPRPAVGRRRAIGAIVLVGLIVLLASFRGLLGLYTDYLWYDDLDRTSVWTGILGAKIALSAVFIAIFFVLAWLNLVIADRSAPALRPPGPEEELLLRWHETIGQRNGLVRFVIAGFFALVAGGGAASQWNEWVLFTNQVDFAAPVDPVFEQNVSFYVFRLPFLTFLVSWFFAAVIIIGILTTIWHYIHGGIRIQTVDRRTTPQVKAHLSVLLAVLALLKAADYWLQRYQLLGSTQGFGRGAFYTDLNANLPAIKLLLLISLFSVGLLVANIWRRGWVLPSIAVGLWALIAVVAGGIYPAAIQQFQVSPDQLSRERPFIERNISATRVALGLDAVAEGDFTFTGTIDRERLISDQSDVFSSVRLLDPRIVEDSFTLNQRDREVYDDFAGGVDVDRYVINGVLTPVLVGVREISNASNESWERRHAVFTHGYGLVLAPANRFTGEGEPDFLIRDTPIQNDVADSIELTRPQVYFGDDISGYAVVNTTSAEFDFIDGYSYDGDGGVPLDSFIKRFAFASRFGDIEPLISGIITDETEVIFERDVTERARRIAPFLTYDSDPYPVVVDGGVVYVIDAYTTSDMYPYAERADVSQVPPGADLRHNFNYVRNSVKVVVDGFDGTVDFYVVDPDEPILKAYRQAFPELFSDIDEMPRELRDHLRFPEDLFLVQTEMWGQFQLDDPSEFFDKALRWEVADNPDSVSGGQRTFTVDRTTDPQNPRLVPDRSRPVDPYYQVTRLPDETELGFVISRPFVPVGLRELTSYMVGRVDESGRPELRQYQMNSVEVDGPFQVDELLNIDPTISEESTELGRGGSQFLSGNLMLLLVDEAVVYVRPFYSRKEPPADDPTKDTEPKIVFVAVVQENRIGFAPSYVGALAELYNLSLDEAAQLAGTAAPTEPEQISPSGAIDTEDPVIVERLNQILRAFSDAEEALPDFAEYERLLDAARDDLQALLDEVEGGEFPDAIAQPADPDAA